MARRLLPLSDILAARRLLQSGLFDVESYHRFNPDVPGSDGRLALHYVRHGRAEERRFLRSGVSEWLLPAVISGQVPAGVARQLQDPIDESSVRSTCDAYGLSLDAYRFHTAYGRGAFQAAEAILPALPLLERIEGTHKLAVRLGRIDAIPALLDLIIADTSRLAKMTPETLCAISDLAEADGRDTPNLMQDLLDAVLETGTEHLNRHLWTMRLPSMREHTRLLPSSVAGWDAVFEAARANRLNEKDTCLRFDPETAIWSSAVDGDGEKVALRLPHATHWMIADTNELSASFISVFKKVTAVLAEEGAVFVPLQGGRIHNVSRMNTRGLPLMSYHGFTDAPRKGLFFKESALPDYFSVNPTGYSGWAQAILHRDAPDGEAASAFFDDLVSTMVGPGRTKYQQDHTAPKPSGPYILFVMQVSDDSVIQHADLGTETIIETVIAALDDTETKLVVKLHPKDIRLESRALVERLRAEYSALETSTAAIHDLIAGAKAVITINSGAGVEALLHRKPVITVGASDYEPVTYRAQTADALSQLVNALDKDPVLPCSLEDIQRFLYDRYARESVTVQAFPDAVRQMARTALDLGERPYPTG